MYAHFKKRDRQLDILAKALQKAGVRTRRNHIDENLGVGKIGGKTHTGAVAVRLNPADLTWEYSLVLSKREYGPASRVEALAWIMSWAGCSSAIKKAVG